MAATVETTATIVAIDGHDHTVTLEFLDGRVQEINVGKHRDLSNVGLGDSVRIQLTEAVAIAVKSSPRETRAFHLPAAHKRSSPGRPLNSKSRSRASRSMRSRS